jgi:prepilin-type N-terminal cleavage/methylation domain-containing protein
MKKTSGFTLTESIITVVILSLISFVVMHVMVEGFRVWWENRDYVDLRSSARTALDRIAAEFREAESVTLVDEQDLQFDSDPDRDGLVGTIEYQLVGNALIRTENGQAQPVCEGVSSITFEWAAPVLGIDMTLAGSESTVRVRTDVSARGLP